MTTSHKQPEKGVNNTPLNDLLKHDLITINKKIHLIDSEYPNELLKFKYGCLNGEETKQKT